MNLNRRRSSGFTLVEVVMATAVLAITITGVLAVVVETSRLNQHNEERKIAEKQANGMMAQIEAEAKSNTKKELVKFLNNKNQFSVKGLRPVEGQNHVGRITYDVEPDPKNKKKYVAVKTNVILRWQGVMGESSFSISKIVSVRKEG